MLFEIHESNFDRLQKKLATIGNKCKKYGNDFSFEVKGETFRELTDENHQKYIARFIAVDVEGRAKLNNWEFVAEVENTENGNIIKGISNVEVPERYYNCKPFCEHCQTRRYRKYTYIVRNTETGEFKQVGKSCLKDFTFGMSAEAVANYISAYDELIEGESPVGGGWHENYVDVKTALLYISETINKFGYVRNGSSERSTSQRAFDYYLTENGNIDLRIREHCLREMAEAGFKADTEKNQNAVEKALEWIESQPESDSNYIHNLKVACSLEYVKSKNFGILASLFPAYDRELEYQARKKEQEEKAAAERKSEYVGEVKQRITFDIKEHDVLTSWETDWGITFMHKFTDENGNVFIWKTSNTVKDDCQTITGTIKEHSEFRGIKQTVLTRCKIA